MAASKALINYYARLLRKGQKKKSEIPDDIMDAVIEAYEKLPPVEVDPVTQTPEKK